MIFLTLVAADIDLKLVTFRRRPDRVRGEIAVSFANTLLDGTDQRKREWEGETIEYTPEEVDAIRAAITPGPVVIGGEKLRGGTVTVYVAVEGESSERDGDDAFLEALNLLFREA
jgi:hypothetical protein